MRMVHPATIKVQTLNLWHDSIEYENRTEGVIKRINRDRPDVLCLQEVTFPPNTPNTAEIIASRTNMKIVSIHAQNNPNRGDGVKTGNAILTTLKPITHPTTLTEKEPGRPATTDFAPYGHQQLFFNTKRGLSETAIWAWLKTPNNNDLLVITTHLSWGVSNEYQRLQEAIDVNDLAMLLTKNNPYALTILGMSANAEPNNDSIRFLKGQIAVKDTENFWLDVWEYANNDENATGHTQTPRNVWTKVMAARQGTMMPRYLPPRRIDYLMVRDWVYGQNGSPMSTRIAFSEPLGTGVRPDATVSDHYGVEAKFADFPRTPDSPFYGEADDENHVQYVVDDD